MLLKVVLFFFTNGKHQLHKLSDTHPQTDARTHTPRSVREQQGFKFISICLEFQTFIDISLFLPQCLAPVQICSIKHMFDIKILMKTTKIQEFNKMFHVRPFGRTTATTHLLNLQVFQPQLPNN